MTKENFKSAASTASLDSEHSGDSTDIANTTKNMDNKQSENDKKCREIQMLPDRDVEASIYFRDGIRTIDFILVWDELDQEALREKRKRMRKKYEDNLKLEGLELETEHLEPNGLTFIKVHAPLQVLRCYSEILKLRMPMKKEPTEKDSQSCTSSRKERKKTSVREFFFSCLNSFHVDIKSFPTMEHRLTTVYSRDKEYLFDVDTEEFFSPSTHSRIIKFILDRTRFTDDDEEKFSFGIDRLIAEKAYVAAYPLHMGDLHNPDCMRHLLYTKWASVRNCFHYQPLEYVKEYFGVKIGLYFAWLGFYTYILILPSIVGVLCFIYSCLTLYSNKPSEDICFGNLTIKMCPLCDRKCPFWDLNDTCFQARMTYLFDNPSTVFFAIFMSLWATLFLEFWKRYSAEITHRWDLTGLDTQEEHPRPQYLVHLAHMEKKPNDGVSEVESQFVKDKIYKHQDLPSVSFWGKKFPGILLSFSVVLLLIAIAIAAVLAVVFYRMSILTADWLTRHAVLFTTVTAASINLCCILIFKWIYIQVAEYLTEIELHRTQTEFDDSLTLKIYLLQFVNYYTSIFYIAFIKGKFVGHPGKYKRVFNFRQEECRPGGCLMELTIQLSIIMVGKQAMNTVLEMLWPWFYKWRNTMKIHVGSVKDKNSEKGSTSGMSLQWVRDYKLVQWGPRNLFAEYLEMVLQYGFVTIFVAAFPLAPLFALLNNVLEMRLDAKKLLTLHRRPVNYRVRDIGVWYRILDSISKLSVITNGFIIAFTSNFIPRLVYIMTVSHNRTLEGFLEHSLSKFDTNDLQYLPYNISHNEIPAICRYADYRKPPNSPNKYQPSSMYWHVLAARLAFVVVFENVVAVLMILMRWCIPNMTHELRNRIQREFYITNEMIIRQEAIHACGPCQHKKSVTRVSLSNDDHAQESNKVIQNSSSNADFDLEVVDSPAVILE